MLYYCEFKDAIERGFINQDTIMTSRINGQLHDYILRSGFSWFVPLPDRGEEPFV